MAQNLDDCEFWLPPKFLADDDTSFININNNKNGNKLFSSPSNDDVFNAGSNTLFPYYFTSPLTSSETESDEEEQIAELTRQMTHSTLQHHKLALDNHHHHHKIIFVNGSSQQPTRSAFENRSYGQGSNPNDTVLSQRATLDLLRAAAGEVERHQVNNDEAFYDFIPEKPFGFHTQNQQHSLSDQKRLQIAQFEMLRRQQQWLKQQEEIVRGSGVLQRQSRNYETIPKREMNNQNVFEGNVGLSSSAWCSLKNESNAKTVFLGNSNNVKKERNGTGVFLPRFVDTQSRKKPACKTVVVPERVVHALNMKVEEGMIRGYMQQKNRFYGTSNIENGVARFGSDHGFSQQKRNMMPQQQQVNREIRLPQEWTY